LTPELHRWNDERLDDLHHRVNENTRKFEEFLNLRSDLIDLRGHVVNAEKVATDALVSLATLQDRLEKRQEAQQAERKADRRWMVGTFLVSASLIAGAVRLFIGG
jgi:benzoyl-CoA reductase/2-hydroxyglutaryl-CoA dehydratase subunit BcrC/BadD/HgdB